MELHVGDRVLCHKPLDGFRFVVGLEGTVIGFESDRYRGGYYVPVIEFDVPIPGGHRGQSFCGKDGHCWNAWGWRPDDGSLSLVEQGTAEERTRKAVLKKIKYLEQKFEQRQKEKKNASTLASVQTGVYVGDGLGNIIRSSAVTGRAITFAYSEAIRSSVLFRSESW